MSELALKFSREVARMFVRSVAIWRVSKLDPEFLSFALAGMKIKVYSICSDFLKSFLAGN